MKILWKDEHLPITQTFRAITDVPDLGPFILAHGCTPKFKEYVERLEGALSLIAALRGKCLLQPNTLYASEAQYREASCEAFNQAADIADAALSP